MSAETISAIYDFTLEAWELLETAVGETEVNSRFDSFWIPECCCGTISHSHESALPMPRPRAS